MTGENSVIGAGNVVNRLIPASCAAAGNPCKVMRYLTEHDIKEKNGEI